MTDPGLSTHPPTEAVGQVRRGYLDATEAREAPALADSEKLRAELEEARNGVLARDYWARDVVFYHELPEQPSDDHFATIAKALKAARAELDSERKRVLALLADLRQARQERAAIALERDELLSERDLHRDRTEDG